MVLGKLVPLKSIRVEDVYVDENVRNEIEIPVSKGESIIIFSYLGDNLKQKVLTILKQRFPKKRVFIPEIKDIERNYIPRNLLKRKHILLFDFDSNIYTANAHKFLLKSKSKGFQIIGISCWGDDEEIIIKKFFENHGIYYKEIFPQKINLIDISEDKTQMEMGLDIMRRWEERLEKLDIKTKYILGIISILIENGIFKHNFGIPKSWISSIVREKMKYEEFENHIEILKFMGFIREYNAILYPDIKVLQILNLKIGTKLDDLLGINDEMDVFIIKRLAYERKYDKAFNLINTINMGSLDKYDKVVYLISLLDIFLGMWFKNMDRYYLEVADSYAQQLYEISRYLHNDELRMNIYLSLGRYFLLKGREFECLNNYRKSLNFFNASFDIARRNKYGLKAKEALIYKVRSYVRMSYIFDPLKNLDDAQNILLRIDENHRLLKLKIMVHKMYHTGRYDMANNILREYEVLLKHTQNPKIYAYMGIVYMLLGQHTLAETFFNELERSLTGSNNIYNLLQAKSLKLYNRIFFSDPLDIIDEAINLSENLEEIFPITYGILNFIVGKTFTHLYKETKNKSYRASAYEYLTLAAKYTKNLPFVLSMIKEELGDIASLSGDFGLATQYYLDSLDTYFASSPHSRDRLYKKLGIKTSE